MSDKSNLFTSTCKVLRDVTVQELKTQNNFLRRQLMSTKDILLHSDVIITRHIDFTKEYKETKGIYIGKCGNNSSRCNVLIKIKDGQYIIKQIMIEKLIFLNSKNRYKEFLKF